ncbi:hypothetical protein [Cellulomonas shaoxiangyii]|uniref:Uncharacterized protein n=1 Tax=Cellulomonas shaoxiangyii TaxID=2566013 RepID=A0A4P7SH59_9CELL|nr:hypothetical protein [Cellulomonas shaoxiangyii]QCB93290.1 hypothetical protein E5225_06740 [Cellulomonas shaoxiangyii]TGY82491.1 hypothetical protein E5226_13210 [Cellulomonas shaoxiangyii]
MRTLREVRDDVRQIRDNSVTRETLREFQVSVRETFERISTEVADERRTREVADEKAKTERLAMIAAESSIRDTQIKTERDARKEDVARLERQFDKVSAWVKWGGSSGLTILVAVIGWIISRGGGG